MLLHQIQRFASEASDRIRGKKSVVVVERSSNLRQGATEIGMILIGGRRAAEWNA